MATYLEYLSFKKKLPWYKRILFPRFLNKEEYKEYIRLATESKTELDVVRDYCFFCWNEYMKNPNWKTKRDLEMARDYVDMYMRKEQLEREKNENNK